MNAGPLTAGSHEVAQVDHDWHTRPPLFLVQMVKLLQGRVRALEQVTSERTGPILCRFSSWFLVEQSLKITYPFKLHGSP